ncbi:ABC transporter ATP-binding protein [Amycolatopsis sp. FDAARGOS 1241]|uniref:ABC transporter ATP-binding protein n=1 Tax=Amycolatopsis sp. FDAARGOS 1241 TaxID=2778070 RepID=UPI001951E119|nr:ABC transporter ATP-binding protein [Amycolatopsis sp. FDAARGOS 1241]QRP48663.1 ABC transporter ATP-binding protein [Amycolatopsis sp. FDAARGOS 1241]
MTHATTGATVVVSRVGKRYSRRRGSANVTLRNVNLQIASGEFVSLVGASGCGKTTLIRMIAGLAPYSSGSITVDGAVVRGVPKRLGFVFQDAALMPWRTLRDNVVMGLNETGADLDRRTVQAKVAEKLALVGLTEYAGYYPRQLSGGMKQRAGLARALVSEPDLLLMDEPFGALDAFTRLRLQEELAAIVAGSNTTTVFVTHDVDEAVFLSDRIVVLTPSPGTVKEIVSVDLPKPRLRRQGLLDNRRAAELRDHVLRLVIEDNVPTRPLAKA